MGVVLPTWCLYLHCFSQMVSDKEQESSTALGYLSHLLASAASLLQVPFGWRADGHGVFHGELLQLFLKGPRP